MCVYIFTKLLTGCAPGAPGVAELLELFCGSLDSFPHEHLTVCPPTSVPCTATIACVADSLFANLKEEEIS